MPRSHLVKIVVFQCFFACATVVATTSLRAQSSLMLEACNALKDSVRRLACLQELLKSKPEAPHKSELRGLSEMRRAFSSIKGSVDVGVSLSQYRSISLEPARALAAFQAENPSAPSDAIALLQRSASAYRDAQEVWNAAIFQSQDAGFFGRVLNWRTAGLGEIVSKYSLQTTTLLMNDHLPADAALRRLWEIGADASKLAFDSIDKPEKVPEK